MSAREAAGRRTGSTRFILRVVLGAAVLLSAVEPALSQEQGPPPPERKVGFKDPLDGAFDLSDRIIESHGFVPVPIVITEPAVGGFGGGLAPVFLHKKPPLESDGKTTPVPPDITAFAGGYTVNQSWFLGGGRVATIEKHRLRYRVAGAYANLNVDFYETLPSGEERAVEFNGRTVPVYLNVAKQLRDPRFTLGGQYIFGKTKLKLADGGSLPDFVTDQELDSTISAVGAVAEFDSRDNIFTPDQGFKVHANFDWSDDWLGSDYRYGRLNSFAYWYAPIGKKWSNGRNWVSGLRFDLQQSFGDPPFYLLPFIDMRGIPSARYQGRTDVLLETDQRFDFTRRWSAVVFGGVGKAFDHWSEAGDADLVYSYGAGFRYLLARKFKLRMGVDVARGPEEWAYYIVFGSAWLK